MATYNSVTHSQSMGISTAPAVKHDWFYLLQRDASYPMMELIMNDSISKEWSGQEWSMPIADDPGDPGPRTTDYRQYDANNRRKGYRVKMAPCRGVEDDLIDQADVDKNKGNANWADEQELGIQQMWQRVAQTIEQRAWRVPAAGEFTLIESGIPYFVNWPSTTSTEFNFVGSTPSSGYSLVANFDPTTAGALWKNGAVKYTDFTWEDFGKAIMTLMAKIAFRPPPNVKGPQNVTTTSNMRIYCGQQQHRELPGMFRAQNDQMGRELLTPAGLLGGIEPTIIWQLNDTSNGGAVTVGSLPFYFINHNHLFPVFVPGWKFRTRNEKIERSTMTATFVEWYFNWFCTGRAHQAVAAKAVPYAEA